MCFKGTDLLKHPLGQWLKGNGHNSWNFFQHPTTKWLYEQRKVNGNPKWFRYGPTPENKKVFNPDAGLPCTAPKKKVKGLATIVLIIDLGNILVRMVTNAHKPKGLLNASGKSY